MRIRPSARVILIDEDNRVLLLKFSFSSGSLAGKIFWATPGGALAQGESFEDGARRELFEETGLKVEVLGEPLSERTFSMMLPDGETVQAQEKIFYSRARQKQVNPEYRTEEEREIISAHKWWQIEEIETASEKIYPEDLVDLLKNLLFNSPSP